MKASTKIPLRRPTARDAVAVVGRRRFGHSVAETEVRPESWAWVPFNFAVGAPISATPVIVGAADMRRALPRVAGLAAGVGAGWVTVAAPGSTGWGWACWATAAEVAALNGYRWVEAARLWPHRRRWVRPLATALRHQLGYPADLPERHWLLVPRDLASDEDGVRILLPREFIGRRKEREHLELTVLAKLGLDEDDTTVSWLLAGRQHEVVFRAKVRPPALVGFAEVVDLIERRREATPLMGLTTGRRAVAPDVDSEAPHLAFSGRTGAGKTEFIAGLAAQFMHKGASLTVLDWRRRSHKWAKGLEGVTYCRDIAEIHDALVELAAEAMERNKLADRYPGDAEPPWQRRIVIVEELNATMDLLQDYWHHDLGKKGKSPAVRGYRQILFAGRQVKIHLLTAAQLLTSEAAGGPAARSQYGMIALARYKPDGWRMLVKEITPIPKSSNHPGRWQICIGGEAFETQVVHWTKAELREWASTGKPSTVVSLSEVAAVAGLAPNGSQGEGSATVAGRPHLTVVADPDDAESPAGLVTLWRASIDKGDALLGLTYDQLRQAPYRDPEFPEPRARTGRARLYDLHELARWAANRERPA